MSEELPGESPANKLDPIMTGFDLTKPAEKFANAIEATVEQQRKRAEYKAALVRKLNYVRYQNEKSQREYYGKRLGLIGFGLIVALIIRKRL